ncbi:MAG: cysteine--tRNA ligase [Spirochaetes bacterium]|nr:cysteine--tRNA ligase [Spirochaetota bacterium]
MLKLYNTLTQKTEEFKPLDPQEVKMYICGPTVYNHIHIGNARPVIFFDTVRRYLEYKGYRVKLVQNFTDIDDKLINQANEEKTTVKSIAEKYIKAFYEDTASLNIKEGILRPQATEHIDQMIDLVKKLEEQGIAYQIEGDVYFNIEKFQSYGKLSHRNLEDLKSGARIEVNDSKKAPLDFTLWKKAKPGEPQWASPWGPGRPGWHLECSVMSAEYLGKTFDIHGGGNDLIFPHHENEIAQSEAAFNQDFCHYWMHVGMLNIRGEKMSKSKGNFFYLKDVLSQYSGSQLRMFMLSSHYKKPIDFSEEEMAMAKSKLDRLENTMQRLEEALQQTEGGAVNEDNLQVLKTKLNESKNRFNQGMDEDFNTAIAIGAAFELIKEINIYLDRNSLYAAEKKILMEAKEFIHLVMEQVLGIKIETEKQVGSDLTKELIEYLLELRRQARADKDWNLADSIRDRLAELGISIKDSKDKTSWTID